MKGFDHIGSVVAGAAFLAASGIAHGQWLERTHPLQAGWNAVYMEVDPAPAEADALFAGLPIEEVWARSARLGVDGPPDCADPNDPDCVPDVSSSWDVWLPPSDPRRVVTNLRLIDGGQVYLIRAAAPTVLTLTGTPNGSVAMWKSGYNLAGGHVEDDPADAPTFGANFAGSTAFATPSVFEVLPDGSPSPVANPANIKIKPGVGYWIRSARDTSYGGPIRIDNGSLRGVDFGVDAVEHAIRFENRVASARPVDVTYVPSAGVPSVQPSEPTNAGDVPIKWFEYVSGPVESALQWNTLTTASWNLAAAGNAAARATVQIAIDRVGLPGAVVDSSGQGSQYQGLLLVRDGAGFRRWLSVVGQVPVSVAAGRSRSAMDRPGLYFGNVTVNQVQWASAGARTWTNDDPNDPTFANEGRCVGGAVDGSPCHDDAKCPGGRCEGYCIGGANHDAVCTAAVHCPDGRCSMETDDLTLRPAPAEFTFPIIIHLAEDGAYKLLSEVTLLWQPPNEASQMPGRFVLATPACDPAVCDALEAASIQDGEPFARRLGTAAFSFDGDLPLSGDFDLALEGEYTIPEDHPLNPFRHKYHPDHDCDQVGECYEVARSLRFSFAATPPEGETRPGWGDRILGGTYEETLHGLHRKPITVGGRFEISRVSGVAALNAQ